MLAESRLRLLPRRIVALTRSLPGTALFLALLLAATLDGRVRHAFGLVHDGPEGAVWIHRWCRRIVRCLGIECTVDREAGGELPGRLSASGEGFEAVVCNHLSYIDILLLAAARPFVMVAKTEVRRWPLLGWLTARAGTVYVDRGGRPETYPAVNAAMARAYRSRLPVLFFPEGTTTNGSEVLPFRRGLFHSVLRDSVQVRTAALSYDLDGSNPEATIAQNVCWCGDAAFVPHLFHFLGLRGLRASVRFGPVVRGTDRFVLSEKAHSEVSAIYTSLIGNSNAAAKAAPAGADRLRQQPGMVQAL